MLAAWLNTRAEYNSTGTLLQVTRCRLKTQMEERALVLQALSLECAR